MKNESLTLKQLRENQGLSQQQVADKTGKTKTYISLLENGKRNPSDSLKEVLAKLYKVEISQIFLASKLTKC